MRILDIYAYQWKIIGLFRKIGKDRFFLGDNLNKLRYPMALLPESRKQKLSSYTESS